MNQQDHHPIEQLGPFLDGDLSEAERAAVERHLAVCDHCLAEIEALRDLASGARALPREVEPSRDLWPEIAARIGGSERSPREPLALHARPAWRAVAGTRVLRIAAAIALVVASSAITARVLRSPDELTTLARQTVAPSEATTAVAAFAPTEREYRMAVDALTLELAARRRSLSPETIATVEENLRIIDQAIGEATAAMQSDPGGSEIPLILSGVYRQKVDLLEDAVELARGS